MRWYYRGGSDGSRRCKGGPTRQRRRAKIDHGSILLKLSMAHTAALHPACGTMECWLWRRLGHSWRTAQDRGLLNVAFGFAHASEHHINVMRRISDPSSWRDGTGNCACLIADMAAVIRRAGLAVSHVAAIHIHGGHWQRHARGVGRGCHTACSEHRKKRNCKHAGKIRHGVVVDLIVVSVEVVFERQSQAGARHAKLPRRAKEVDPKDGIIHAVRARP